MSQGIPFAVTEYAEQSAEGQRDALPMFARRALQASAHINLEQTRNLNRALTAEHPITFNPFARPGQRPISPTRLPSLVNGFTLKVV